MRKRHFLHRWARASLALLVATPALGQPVLGGTFVSPRLAIMNQPTQMTFRVSIPSPSVIPNSVNLLRIASNGVASIIGTLHDDGLNGDAFAGDGIYSWQGTIIERDAGQASFQVSAAFRGTLQRARAGFQPIAVQASDASDVALRALAISLAGSNITAALTYFEDSAGASEMLARLDRAGLLRLSTAFADARLKEARGDTRTYAMPWTASNGHALSLEFTMGLSIQGNWVIVAW